MTFLSEPRLWLLVAPLLLAAAYVAVQLSRQKVVVPA